MDKGVGVQVFDARQHLVCYHQRCLQRERPVAVGEKILKTRSQKLHYHRVIITLNTKPMNCGDSIYEISQANIYTYFHQLVFYKVWSRTTAGGTLFLLAPISSSIFTSFFLSY